MRHIFERGVAGVLALAIFAWTAPRVHADSLRVGTVVPTNFTSLSLYVATEEGAFSKYGLDIVRTDFRGGAQVQQAMFAGAVDIAIAGSSDMTFVAKGAPDIAVAAVGNQPSDGIIVGYDSSIKTTDDLKGKKIGVTTVGSLTEWLMRQLMQKKGWSADAVTLVAVGSSSANKVADLTTGQLDGFVGTLGLGLQLEGSRQGRMLIPAFDIGPNFLAEALFANKEIVRDRPEAVRQFIKGWLDNVAWMRAHKAETVAIWRKYTKYSVEVENQEYDQAMPTMSLNGEFYPAALETLKESIVEMKLLPEAPEMSTLYTSAFLPRNTEQ